MLCVVLFHLIMKLHIVKRVLKRQIDQLISGAVGYGGQAVVLVLKAFLYADRHGDGSILFWCDDKISHNVVKSSIEVEYIIQLLFWIDL